MGHDPMASPPQASEKLAKLAWCAHWHALSQERCASERSLMKLQEDLFPRLEQPWHPQTAEEHPRQRAESGQIACSSAQEEIDALTAEAAVLEQAVTSVHAYLRRNVRDQKLDAGSRASAEQKELDDLSRAAEEAFSSLSDEARQYAGALGAVAKRLCRCEDQVIAAAASRLQSQREAEAALHQQQQHAERMQKLKQELAAHRAAVLQHEAAAAAEAASRQQDLAIREAETSKERQRRIQHREARRQQHLQALQERIQRDREAAGQLQRRLAELANQVASQHQVEADVERLRGPTEAMLKPAMESFSTFAPMHGFSTQQIAKDQRFRAMEALRQEGVSMTPYVCQQISAAKPASLSRPDNLTSAGGLQL